MVKGNTAVMKELNGSFRNIEIKLGDFGEADPEIVKITGQKVYNIDFGQNSKVELGVVSKDGLSITTKGWMGIDVFEWMNEEDAAAMEADRDPVEAPSCPYKIQPDNLGKILWITGAPGLGKSTSAQLLSKTAGYVYYEADCFSACRNPYIPQDVSEPTLAGIYQKPLIGEGLEERREVCQKSQKLFGQMVNGVDYDKEMAKEFYEMMCKDILGERKLNGDWAIAIVTLTRDLRDFIRRSEYCNTRL